LEQFRAPLMAFADTTQSFWAALVAVRWVSPESDYERVPEFIYRQCSRWLAIHPDHPFARQLCQLAAPGKLPVLVGDTIPDFSMPMSGGDTLRLHTLLGKRLTLIDLWASWCAPCRLENREILAPLWSKFHEAGFSIIGYALDSSPEAWKAAIQKDAAAWPQASHLSGDISPFLDTLHVTTIPANFLLDENGTIVAKNLHGEVLAQFVEAFLIK
ncbi:MAG TPA: TlpA disulfide reductase family protein, partial [Saprospiraceae bacterium]|nr:TlpA disulfide reductase family protein [Saprospiraceae bacterium]